MRRPALLLAALLLLLPAAAGGQEQEPSDVQSPQQEAAGEGEPAAAEELPPADRSPRQDPSAVSQPSERPPQPPPGDGPEETAGEAERTPTERPAFTLPLSEEQGGGLVRGRAESLELVRENYAVAAGGVEIRYQDIELEAERLEIDLVSRQVTATGGVMMDQGPRRITADRADFDLGTKTGVFHEATAYVAPDYHFRGTRVAKVGEDEYTVDDGVFTSCEGDTPAWSFRLGRARVEVEGYARIRNASMRVKKVPVFYTPYIVWPAKTERTSGFLIPEIGYSERKGSELGLAYYQTLGRSADTTFHVDTYSEGFLGLGNELRYRPTEGTEGRLVGYVVRDPDAEEEGLGLDEWRWKVDWDHVTEDLPWGLRGVISYHDFSDFQFFRDFERDFNRNTIRFLESRGFVAGDWGPHSLNVLVNERETFVGPATATQPERILTFARLPEIEYQLRKTQIGSTPLYLDALSSLSYLSLDRQRNYNNSYARLDLFPRVTLPLAPAPWLSVSLSAGGRATWYGNSIYSSEELNRLPEEERDRILATSRFKDETLTRAVPVANAEIVGPSFSRIFDVGGAEAVDRQADAGQGGAPGAGDGGEGGTAGGDEEEVDAGDGDAEGGDGEDGDDDGGDRIVKLKHVLEPRLNFNWAGDFDEEDNVPQFDEVDRLGNTVRSFGLRSTRSGRWSLFNRLLAKEAGGSSRELLSLEISQEISFDDRQPLQRSRVTQETTQSGPVSGRLRFTPSLATNVTAQVNYSFFFDNLVSTSLSGGWRLGRVADLGLSWFTNHDAEAGETTSDQVGFYGGVNLLPNRLRLETRINYDIEQSLLQQQRYVLSYSAQCYAVRLEMRDFRAGDRRDTEYFFTLSLKNVGTFLPLTARSTTTLP